MNGKIPLYDKTLEIRNAISSGRIPVRSGTRSGAIAVFFYCAAANAQFGGSTTELPTAWIVAPWLVISAVAISTRWFSQHCRQLTWRAIRRGAAAYAFLVVVPVTVCMILSLMFDSVKDVGLALFTMSLMGIIFSGLALLGLSVAALIVDIAVRRGGSMTK